MASNPYVNKVEFGNRTVMDISDTTAEEADVADGEVFYKGTGERAVGSGSYYSPNDTTESTIEDILADNDLMPFYDTSATTKKNSTWANIKAKLQAFFSNLFVAKSGDTMTGALIFDKVDNAIGYTGTKATYPMIKFVDNTGDTYGNGIVIGGGGLTVIGGGESADTYAAGLGGGEESLYLTNDGNVAVVTNLQNGKSYGKTFTFGADGTFNSPGTLKVNGTDVTDLVTRLKSPYGRTSSANLVFGDTKLRFFIATSSMTTGKPPENAHIIHLSWDHTAGWETQIAVATGTGNLYTRAQNNGTWGPWKRLAFAST